MAVRGNGGPQRAAGLRFRLAATAGRTAATQRFERTRFAIERSIDDPAWAALGVGRRELAALLPEADVLSVHVPLTPETRGLVDAAALAALPRGAIVINTARGGIVDEAALAAELRSGRLGGAALDVFATEPLPAESGLVGVPNLILSPHVAGITADANRRASVLTAENVRRVLEGRPPTVADAARGGG